MKHFGKIEAYWLILLAITLFNATLGESFDSTAFVTVLIALSTMYKGLMVIDHFMELKQANRILRLLMRVYFIIFPSLIIFTLMFAETVRNLTA